MKVRTIEIPGPLVIEPDVHTDTRGLFVQMYSRREYSRYGIDNEFVQDNYSISNQRGTVRGMHFQRQPKAQAKLIQVTRGEIWNAIVDLRRDSRWFGKWWGIELSADSCRQLYVPHGFANGFCSLTEHTSVYYKVDEFYSPQHESGFAWDDNSIAIEWPTAAQALSERDRGAPPFDPELHAFGGLK